MPVVSYCAKVKRFEYRLDTSPSGVLFQESWPKAAAWGQAGAPPWAAP